MTWLWDIQHKEQDISAMKMDRTISSASASMGLCSSHGSSGPTATSLKLSCFRGLDFFSLTELVQPFLVPVRVADGTVGFEFWYLEFANFAGLDEGKESESSFRFLGEGEQLGPLLVLIRALRRRGRVGIVIVRVV